MGVEVYELFKSGSHDADTVELNYQIDGTADELVAKGALYAAAPVLYGNLVRQKASLQRIGEDLWEASVPYGKKKDPETGDSSYSFDTTGGTQHITQSLRTVGRYAIPGKKAKNFKGAIGVTKNPDNIEGVDITMPVFKWSETWYLRVAVMTEAYKHLLFKMTGKVNLDKFRLKAPGEVIFLGASGSQRGEEDWEITFNFAASPNASGLQVGDITIKEKRGWDYLWVRYQDVKDVDAIVKQPQTAYVEQVYEYENFSQLGI